MVLYVCCDRPHSAYSRCDKLAWEPLRLSENCYEFGRLIASLILTAAGRSQPPGNFFPAATASATPPPAARPRPERRDAGAAGCAIARAEAAGRRWSAPPGSGGRE